MIQWYGSIDQVPYFLNPLDYASDYMVDVLVVGAGSNVSITNTTNLLFLSPIFHFLGFLILKISIL